MISKFLSVIPGKVYRGGAPTIKDVSWLKDRYHINKIVSLDQLSGEKIDRVCKMLNIKHVMLPIDGSRQSLLNFLKHDITKLLLNGEPTYVHCQEGKDRTGLAIALFKCQYMKMDPEQAINEAKKLGFGIGVDPTCTKLFEKIIRNCQPTLTDNNMAEDIVSKEREYISDNRSSPLEETHQGSFAPYLSYTRQDPVDNVYHELEDQSPTRENFHSSHYLNKMNEITNDSAPLIGLYNNDAGIYGGSPVIPVGGFIQD